MDFSQQENPHSSFEQEQDWMGNSFHDFLDRIPREHLQNQLFMFSKRFDVEEAIDRAVELEHIIFFEDLAGGLNELAEKTGLELPLRHDRRGKSRLEISEGESARLRELLCEEYEFYDCVKRKLSA